jgi:hypothetical protein
MNLTLGTDSDDRKKIPMFSGCLAYFAAALAGVARHSFVSNEKHNPGEPLHWSRGKSSDHTDCQVRHLTDIADMRAAIKRDATVIPRFHPLVPALLVEANANSWRALALSQELHEEYGGAPLSPASVVPPGEPGVDTVTVKAFRFRIGQKISFTAATDGKRVTGVIDTVHDSGLVVRRDDGHGWTDGNKQGRFWNVFTERDGVELV